MMIQLQGYIIHLDALLLSRTQDAYLLYYGLPTVLLASSYAVNCASVHLELLSCLP